MIFTPAPAPAATITYMTEAAYWKRYSQLDGAIYRAEARRNRWRSELARAAYGTSAYRRADEAENNAYHALNDACRALARFEQNHAIKAR
jgi:hypothetical protein